MATPNRLIPRRLCPTHVDLHGGRTHQHVPDHDTCDVCRLSGYNTATPPPNAALAETGPVPAAA